MAIRDLFYIKSTVSTNGPVREILKNKIVLLDRRPTRPNRLYIISESINLINCYNRICLVGQFSK